MVNIKDYRAIYEFLKRRGERVEGKRLDKEWNDSIEAQEIVDDEPIEEESGYVENLMPDYIRDEIEWLLDSIVQEAETIKVFADKYDKIGMDIKERCIDSIQRSMRHLSSFIKPSKADSAFFAGELNGNLGERNILYPEVEAFKERRKKRLDAKSDEEGKWITTDNGHRVHINEEGEPDKGNPHVIATMTEGEESKESGSASTGKSSAWVKKAKEKISGSNYTTYGIKITDAELEDGSPHVGELSPVGSYVDDKRNTIRIGLNGINGEADFSEDFIREQVKIILDEHGKDLRGKNVYLVGASKGKVRPGKYLPEDEGEVLCKIFERGGEEEKSLGMQVNESAPEKRYGERRRQVPVPWREISSYDERRLKKFNQDALKSIIEETGMGRKEAKEFHKCLLDYFGGDYLSYAKGEKKEDVDKIDAGLKRMGAYDGEIWRGMRFRDDAPEGAPDSGGIDAFKNLEVGDEIGMKSVSSWSSDERAARKFASLSSFAGLEPENSVMICCRKNKTSVGLQHISKFRGEEAEVLARSDTRWRVVGKKIVSVYDYMKGKDQFWEKEIEKSYSKEEKKRAMSHFVVILDVEEV